VDSFDFLFCFKFNKKSLTGLISFIPEGFDTLQLSYGHVPNQSNERKNEKTDTKI